MSLAVTKMQTRCNNDKIRCNVQFSLAITVHFRFPLEEVPVIFLSQFAAFTSLAFTYFLLRKWTYNERAAKISLDLT